MLMKLALRNVRRSVRDYAVYFVTLTLGVAVFYAFNAIGDSRVLFEAQEGAANVFLTSGASIFDILVLVMTYFSIVVAVVLGFLVLYANRFVVRARKKEFGTYLLLGMSPRQVSSVVLMETLIVGVIALVVGLGLGFLISQAIAFATAGLIGVAISDYHLLFSARSAELTLGCFALIFVVVALFNAVQISRCKLATLFSANSRNERMPVRNPIVCLIVFVLSCLILAKAYAELNLDGLVYFGEHFRTATVLMLVGTLGLFWSASGFLILLIQRLRGVYFKGLAHVHHAPNRREGEHCVRIAVGGYRSSILQHRCVLHGLQSGVALLRSAGREHPVRRIHPREPDVARHLRHGISVGRPVWRGRGEGGRDSGDRGSARRDSPPMASERRLYCRIYEVAHP